MYPAGAGEKSPGHKKGHKLRPKLLEGMGHDEMGGEKDPGHVKKFGKLALGEGYIINQRFFAQDPVRQEICHRGPMPAVPLGILQHTADEAGDQNEKNDKGGND